MSSPDTTGMSETPSPMSDLMFEDVFHMSPNDLSPMLMDPSLTSPTVQDPPTPTTIFSFPNNPPPFPSPKSPISKKRSRKTAPTNVDKSRIAQQRRRDPRGQFIRREVADRLEELETQLEYQETECETLRNSISERETQVNILKEKLRQMTTPQYSYVPVSNPQAYYPLQTTSRNYFVVPSPNPGLQFDFQGRQAFKDKIDYTKIELRKTDSSLDEEKREVENSQEEWAIRQTQQQFMRKLQEQAQWNALVYQQQTSPMNPTSIYGGAPSNIYPETQNKVGNLPVSAFTTKINLEDQRQQLGKRGREYIQIQDDPQRKELMRMIQERAAKQNDMYPQ